MKLLYTLLATLCLSIAINAQVTNEGAPKSWRIENPKQLNAIVMPAFDLEKITKEDEANSQRKDMPFRFGYEFITDYSLTNSGTWQTLPNGDRIWKIRFFSEGAKTMNFVLTNFNLPEGGSLYLYNDDRTDVLGAYTSSQNSEEKVLGTWLISGEDVWIEYYEPKRVKNQGNFAITKVVHGYRSSNDFIRRNYKDLNESDGCNYDVNCPIGALDNLKDINKKSAGLIIVGNSGFCSGALINNTNNDGTPYFLTANHCVGNNPSEVSQWAFRFNWISPNPVCSGFTPSTSNSNYYQTVSGSTIKARREQSDFCLLQITAGLPASWDVNFAGWDRSTNVPSSTFGIHHPSGDIMKVCRDDNAPSQSNNGISVWIVNNWDLGVTEGGSSGSPLFNNQGRIIGQLLGGDAACDGTTDNGGSDEYGRLNVSWAGGNSPSSRLREWLDPNNTGVTTLDYYNRDFLSTGNSNFDSKLLVYPNPSNGIFTIETTKVVSGTYEIYNTLGQIVKSGKITTGNTTVNLSSSSNGVYFIKVKDLATGSTKNTKLIKE